MKASRPSDPQTLRPLGFTLMEVLASITIIAIILPTIMYGISLTTNAASLAKHRTLATTLAQAKLDELLVTQEFQSPAGDFGDHAPGFRWSASISPYDSPTTDGLTTTLTQLDVTVTWTERNQPRQATLSTLLYQNATSSGSSGLGGFGL